MKNRNNINLAILSLSKAQSIALIVMLAIAVIVGVRTTEYHTLTVHYRLENGESIAPNYTTRMRAGETYAVHSPKITGYIPDHNVVNGVMRDFKEVWDVRYYREGAEATTTVTYYIWNGDKFVYHDNIVMINLNGETTALLSPMVRDYEPSRVVGKDGTTNADTLSMSYRG